MQKLTQKYRTLIGLVAAIVTFSAVTEGQIRPSGPRTSDPLRVRTTSEVSELTLGHRYEIEVEIENVSDTELTLCSRPGFVWGLEGVPSSDTDAPGLRWWISRAGKWWKGIDDDEPDFVELAPGVRTTVSLEVKVPDQTYTADARFWIMLRSGHLAGGAEKPVWLGAVESEPQRVRLVPPARPN